MSRSLRTQDATGGRPPQDRIRPVFFSLPIRRRLLPHADEAVDILWVAAEKALDHGQQVRIRPLAPLRRDVARFEVRDQRPQRLFPVQQMLCERRIACDTQEISLADPETSRSQ